MNKEDNGKNFILFYVLSVIFYIFCIVSFIKNRANEAILMLAMGSAMLCLGASNIKKNHHNKNNDK